MSGSCVTSGILTEKNESLEIERLMNLKIKDLSILIIPLKSNIHINRLRIIGQFLQMFIHPSILSPTLSHIAIQLNMENDEDIIIMEYGQYLTDQSEIEKSNIFGSFGSCSDEYNRPKIIENKNNLFWFINKDGLRMTKIDTKYLFFGALGLRGKERRAKIISKIIACNHYGISDEEFQKINTSLLIGTLFDWVNCDIQNKITLNELCNEFKGEKWEAKNYNLATQNCQHFAAKVIGILKAIRIKDLDKIRTNEKLTLPNCIISALWDNEKLSLTNSIGRIPFFGLFYDLYRLVKDG